MSDDDYYANSPYGDYDDLMWDDGASQDLAGDLAEHTLHSPVYQDDPGYELLHGFSDWEYYSDDYYDDDPSILKGNPQDGSPLIRSKRTQTQSASTKKAKKRKLADTKDIPPLALDEGKTLESCIVGTVWAVPKAEEYNTYREGESNKVSLLKDWRDVFKSTPANLRGMARRDESWANDMSLEDMGLYATKSHEVPDVGTGDAELDEPEEEEDVESQRSIFAGELSDGHEEFDRLDLDLQYNEEESGPRKRPKWRGLPSPPPSNEAAIRDKSGEGREDIENEKGGKIFGNRESFLLKKSRGSQSPLASSALASEGASLEVQSRKRKASTDNKDQIIEGIAPKAISSSRAKRIASSKLSSKPDIGADNAPPLPSARVTRSRKK